MKTTYDIKFAGIDADQLGDLLTVVNESNRKCHGARVRLPEPEIVVKRPDHFDVVLVSAGGNKIQVIKTVREIAGLGLKEAKDLVEAVPRVVLEQQPRHEAERFTAALNEAGALAQMR